MPNIIIEAAEISKENKVKLIKTLTREASEITNIPEASFTVQVREFPVENWGVGGVPLEEIIKNAH